MRACCGDDQDNYLAYYCCAIRVREREGVPTIGVSVDRRTFGHLVEAYNSNKVRSLICVCCAQIHTDTGAGEQSDIMMTQGPSQIFTRLAPKEDDSAEVMSEKMRRLELEFGLAKFKQRYGHGPLANVQDLEENDDASEWQQRLELGQRRRRLSRKRANRIVDAHPMLPRRHRVRRAPAWKLHLRCVPCASVQGLQAEVVHGAALPMCPHGPGQR